MTFAFALMIGGCALQRLEPQPLDPGRSQAAFLAFDRRDAALRGALERLPSILMTALVTGLGLAPLALGSAEPGREIEGPMATIIVGGLASSTLLNLLILPTVLLHFGRFRRNADG